jgi:pimeloyl-ACP methyl ester carboxylesterase
MMRRLRRTKAKPSPMFSIASNRTKKRRNWPPMGTASSTFPRKRSLRLCITVAVGAPLWKDRPAWFLLAEQDRMIVEETQRFMADRMKAQIRPFAVDHTPIVTAPTAVADVIREALRSVE